MSYLKHFTVVVPALLGTLIAAPAMAQTTPDMVGAWHGKAAIATGDQMMALTVTRGSDGTLTGEFENRDVAPGRKAPVSEIVAADGRLTFKIAPLNISYEATWDEAAGLWRGKISRGATALDFARGPAPAKPRIAGMEGLWEAVLQDKTTRLRWNLRVASGDWGTNALLDLPDQYISNMVLSDFAREGRLVRFSVGRGGGKYEGVLSEDGEVLNGTMKAPAGEKAPISFTRTQSVADRPPPNRPQNPKDPLPYRQEEVAFDNAASPGIRLAGTLTLPQGKGPFPAAILIAGSGQHDRDETLDGHKPFLVIADHLTRNGIAVLRFDDRGAGKSTGEAYDATAGDKASDANAAFSWLLGRPDIRHDAIGFIGHSEGGLIGPIAMAGNDKVAFLVSLAGPSVDIVALMRSQRRMMAIGEGSTAERERRLDPIFVSLFQALRAGRTPAEGRTAALALLTPETKIAMGVTPETDSELMLRDLIRPRVWYLAHNDTAKNIERITVPVLALNGSLDVQTEAKLNLEGWRKGLKTNRDATILELPSINHMFQRARTGLRGEYRDIEETFDPATLTLISDWIGKRFIKP